MSSALSTSNPVSRPVETAVPTSERNGVNDNASKQSQNEISSLVKGALQENKDPVPGSKPGNAASATSPGKQPGKTSDESAAGDPKTKSSRNSGLSGASMYGNNFQAVAGEGAQIKQCNSKQFKQNVSGDAANGTTVKQQMGTWSEGGTQKSVDDKGVAAGAHKSGSFGGEVDGGFAKTGLAGSTTGQGSAWGGGQGRVSANGVASAERGVYAQSGVEARTGVGADAQTKTKAGPIEVGASGSALAGAETSNGFFVGAKKATDEEKAAGLQSKIGVDGSAGGFAGAKASGGVNAGVAGSTAGVNGSAYAGVGAEAKGHANLEQDKDGKTYLNLGGKVGAAMGVGAGVGADVRINVTPLDKLAKAAGNVGDKIGDKDSKDNNDHHPAKDKARA